MFRRILPEATALAALAIAVTALVVALRAGGPDSTAVGAEQAADAAGPVRLLDFVPKGAEEVVIAKFAYDPDPVRVQVGQAVVWRNMDLAAHTVTARDGSWDSGMLRQNDTVVMTFDEPGVYAYICKLHPPHLGASLAPPEGEALVAGGGGPGMEGTIIVE